MCVYNTHTHIHIYIVFYNEHAYSEEKGKENMKEIWTKKGVSLAKSNHYVMLFYKIGSMKVRVLVTQLCPTLCDPIYLSLAGSSVHGILQARILEWVAIPFSRGSSWHRDLTQVSLILCRFFTIWATKEAQAVDFILKT